ncbi:MAG: LptF/LptG family permease [Planctomycetota bacterium]|jgi:lipopolysaccharide export system permease protein
MKLLDRYVVKTFLTVFVTALVVFTVSIVTIDFFTRLGDFQDEKVVEGTSVEGASKLVLIARFYMAYLPSILKDMLSFVSVAAGMFTVTHLLRNNEVQPVLAAGISARRLFAPVFCCGFLIALGHLAFQEFVVPSLNREQIAVKRMFSGDYDTKEDNVPHLRDGKGTVTRVSSYSFADQSLSDVTVARPWTEAGFERWFTERLEPDGKVWRAASPVFIQPAGIASVGRTLRPGARVDIGVSPDEVEALASRHGTTELSLTQLRALANKFPDRRNLQVAVQKQIARPLTSFVLLIVGIPMLLGFGRSLVAGAAIAFGVSASYYFLEIFLTSLGDRGEIPAVVAVWFPIALYLSLGLARLMTVRT